MKIDLYTKPDCPWCDKAKELLTSKGFEYNELVVGKDYQKEDLQAKLPFITRMTVPRIFVDDEHIGGYEELKAYVALEETVGGIVGAFTSPEDNK
jgi:glutathione-dependent peroxiredoxin